MKSKKIKKTIILAIVFMTMFFVIGNKNVYAFNFDLKSSVCERDHDDQVLDFCEDSLVLNYTMLSDFFDELGCLYYFWTDTRNVMPAHMQLSMYVRDDEDIGGQNAETDDRSLLMYVRTKSNTGDIDYPIEQIHFYDVYGTNSCGDMEWGMNGKVQPEVGNLEQVGCIRKSLYDYRRAGKKCPTLYYKVTGTVSKDGKYYRMTYVSLKPKNDFMEAKAWDTENPYKKKKKEEPKPKDNKPKECTPEQKKELKQHLNDYIWDKIKKSKDEGGLGWEEPVENDREEEYYIDLINQLDEEYNAFLIELAAEGEKYMEEVLKCTCPIDKHNRTCLDWYIRDLMGDPDQNDGFRGRRQNKIDNAYRKNENLDEEAKKRIEDASNKAKESNKKQLELIRLEIRRWMGRFSKGIAGESCSSVLSEDLKDKIKQYINYGRVIVPILLIVLGMVDFGKAVLIQEKNDSNNIAFTTFIKRCIIAVSIFFLPLVLSILINAYNEAVEKNPDLPAIDLLKNCDID